MTKVFLPPAKNVGAPWLSFSTVSGNAMQSSRMCASASSFFGRFMH
jgi:hypothetical protein